MTSSYARLAAVCALSLSLSACALSARTPSIAELERHPGRYQRHSVSISGIVTNSWALPLVPFSFYRVDDGTGELTVLSQNVRTPSRGERVRVKGEVNDLAVVAGTPLGLHLREQALYVKQ